MFSKSHSNLILTWILAIVGTEYIFDKGRHRRTARQRGAHRRALLALWLWHNFVDEIELCALIIVETQSHLAARARICACATRDCQQ